MSVLSLILMACDHKILTGRRNIYRLIYMNPLINKIAFNYIYYNWTIEYKSVLNKALILQPDKI